MTQKERIVEVKFLDHTSYHQVTKDEELEPGVMRIWGLIHKQDKESITIAQSISDDNDNNDYFVVVKSTILKITELKKAGK